MAHRLAALSATALLIIVALLATASPVAHPGPATAGTLATQEHPAIPVISGYTTDFYGYGENNFYPGAPSGNVYFVVHDPADDNAVTVQIFDSNATRDGLTNPVASWVVNASTGSYASWAYGQHYTIPATVVYGGNWNITFSGTLGGNYSYPFTVQTYTVWAHSTQVLRPTQTGTVWFNVNATNGGGPYAHISTVNLSAVYYDGTTLTYMPLNLSQTSWTGTADGSATFVVPLNASDEGFVYVSVWANVTNNGLFTQEFTTNGDWATAIAEYQYTDLDGGCSCIGGLIVPNSQVYIYLYPYQWSYWWGYQYAPGLTMDISFLNGATAVPNSAIPGNPPSTLVTPASGYTWFTFEASSAVFSTQVNYLNVSVVAVPSLNGSAIQWDNYSQPFQLAVNGTSGAQLTASYGAASYVGGETATVNWTLLPVAGGSLAGWAGQAYSVTAVSDDYSPPIQVAQGYLTGTSGTISFTVPSNFNGYLYTAITAQNGTITIEQSWYVDVYSAQILLTPSVEEYTPGQTFSVGVQTVGSGFAGATLFWAVYPEDSDFALETGTVTGSSFAVVAPSQASVGEVEVYVWAQSSTQGTFAYAYFYIDAAASLNVVVGISTTSLYSDGSFQPGQTVTVTWSQHSVGEASVTSLWVVYLWNANGWWDGGGWLARSITTNLSGSFSYTIPSGTPAGQLTLYVEVEPWTACQGSCYGAGQTSFNVNPSPSALNYELGAGSGLTVGWLILLLLIIIVAIILVLMIRRGRSPKTPPSNATSVTQPMNPPAPAPSTPPAAEWQGGSSSSGGSAPASSGDGQPPLPQPPAGAQ